MEPALHELSSTLADLNTAINGMVVDQRSAERRRNRRSWVTLACALIVALAAIVLTYVAITNRTVLDRINAVTGPAAIDRQAVGTAALLAGNQREGDCLSRRQQARLPAPPAAPAPPPGIKARDLPAFLAPYSCVAQTPREVYPGATGEPARAP